jgi:hypothetical protein
MGDAAASRLYGIRGEGRNTARMGVRAREHFLKSAAMNEDLADADFGLGLYNYYIDTLSAAARVMRFFMGVPGGSKKEGIRQLRRAIQQGVLVPPIKCAVSVGKRRSLCQAGPQRRRSQQLSRSGCGGDQ